jgi:hypothetical protein
MQETSALVKTLMDTNRILQWLNKRNYGKQVAIWFMRGSFDIERQVKDIGSSKNSFTGRYVDP